MAYCLVTGGAGFIGSHLAEALLARGDVVAVVDDESTGDRANLAAVAAHRRLRYVRGSAADASVMAPLLSGATEVYHLAAAVGVQLAVDEPVRTIRTNVLPTDALLAMMRAHCPAAKLFLASTSEVYGKNPQALWREDDASVLGPVTCLRWSYGVSKLLDEFLALAYGRQFGAPVVVARFFNVVGPRQSGAYGMALPRFVDAALSGRSPVVHGDGQQVRCFAHVADVVRAVLALMNCPAAVGQAFNVGSDQPIRIVDLARQAAAAIDPRLEVRFQSYAEAFGAGFEDCRRRTPDLSRLRNAIGFAPDCDWDRILTDVIAWRRARLSGAAPAG